tara:strand:- start:130 stop:312 length:183 start_codon:yes stop_codon:yes gene_type:complete
MITKTVTDDAKLGLKKAVVSMDLPSIEITAYNVADNSLLNTAVKKQLLDVVSEIIDKNLT